MREVRTIVDGLVFAEGPRWHEDALHISDMHGQRVLRIGDDGSVTTEAEIDDMTSGLGWLPDGRLLVVSMAARKIMRRESDGRMVEHADLSEIATFHCNDMIVGTDGTAYVGNFGFSLFPMCDPCTAAVARVTPAGQASVGAANLWFPNGLAITGDGRTLIVAESAGFCLRAFAISADGTLSDRRVWAQLETGHAPDGICLDEEGAAWIAVPHLNKFIRVREGGELLETICVERHALACAMGGLNRRTLLMTVSHELEPERCLDVWSQRLMVQQPRASGRKRYGPDSTRERHDDRGRPSSDTA